MAEKPGLPQTTISLPVQLKAWVKEKAEQLQPDLLIVNGDCIDGQGTKSGGTELLLTDRDEQVDCAVACIEMFGAKKIFMSYGTAYHTGVTEDWENKIAKGVGAVKISGEDSLSVNGLVFNYKHHVGGSSMPYGGYTQLKKEQIWNQIWAARGEYPLGSIIIRSHIHQFKYAGDSMYLTVSTPALQGYGSKYGTRRMSKTVDFGLIWFDVGPEGEYTWDSRTKRYKRATEELLIA